MPTQQELELLALLAEERRRNGSNGHQVRTASSQLPDLTPDMLLSESARREVEAARQLYGSSLPAQQDFLDDFQAPPQRGADRPRTAAEYRASHGQVELSENMGDIDLDHEGPAPQISSNDDALLSSLFMGREAQDAAAVLSGDYTGAAGGYDVEFDSDSMLEGRTTPNPSARFQIGRESPPRMPFSGRMASGPSDGVVVSQRGNNGSWQPRETPRPASAPAPRPSNGTALQAVRQAATRSPASPPRPALPAKSVYDHILDDD